MNSAFSIWTPPCGPDAYSTGSSEPQHRTLFRSRRRLVRRLENRLSCHHGTLLRTRLSLRLHGLPPAGPVRFADEQGGTAFDQLRDIRESHDRFITCLKKLKRSLKNRRVRHFRRGAPRSAPPLRRSGRPACPGGIPPALRRDTGACRTSGTFIFRLQHFNIFFPHLFLFFSASVLI